MVLLVTLVFEEKRVRTDPRAILGNQGDTAEMAFKDLSAHPASQDLQVQTALMANQAGMESQDSPELSVHLVIMDHLGLLVPLAELVEMVCLDFPERWVQQGNLERGVKTVWRAERVEMGCQDLSDSLERMERRVTLDLKVFPAQTAEMAEMEGMARMASMARMVQPAFRGRMATMERKGGEGWTAETARRVGMVETVRIV